MQVQLCPWTSACRELAGRFLPLLPCLPKLLSCPLPWNFQPPQHLPCNFHPLSLLSWGRPQCASRAAQLPSEFRGRPCLSARPHFLCFHGSAASALDWDMSSVCVCLCAIVELRAPRPSAQNSHVEVGNCQHLTMCLICKKGCCRCN